MFDFFKNIGKNRQLEEVVQSIEMNAANNYKDAAQASLKEYEALFHKLKENNVLSEKQKAYYEEKLENYKIDMKNFTHKDQNFTRT